MTSEQQAAVMLVIADMGSGGSQHVVSQLANHWVKQGRQISLLTFTDRRRDFFKVDDNVQRISIDGIKESRSFGQRIAHNVSRIRAIRRALRSFSGRTVIGFIAPMNILLILASIGLPLRVIISERNDPARQRFGLFWDLLRKLTYRYADVVSANSRAALTTLRGYVPEDRLVYLPNPLRQPTSPTGAVVAREPMILHVGRLHPQKGQDLLFRAFARVAHELPGWWLCLVGEGDEQSRLQKLAESLSVADRMVFAGRVEDPFPWYRRASIFAFPSRWEGTPNALIEAMSCGLPVVVSDAAPSVTDLVRHGDDGLIIPADDEAALGDAIVALAKDEHLRARLGKQAAKEVQKFAPETALAAWDNMVWARA
jgi:glycosyltransferase involved in cell wall biosynthesis